MAAGGEVPGRLPGSTGSEHLNRRICQPCLEKDNLINAIGLCVDCQEYLCLKCSGDHKEQQHRMLDTEQNIDGHTQSRSEDTCSDSCPVHENEVIQYYCATHCHLGCKLCIHLDHATCEEVHYIPRISKELVNNEKYRQVEIQLKLALETFMNVFRNTQRNSEELDKSCGDALRELHGFKRQIGEIIENVERDLVEKAHTLRLKAEQELSDMRNKYKTAHEELQSSLANIETLQNANQNCSSYIEMMRTKAKIKSLEDQTQQAEVDISYRKSPIQFTPNRELLEKLRTPGGFGTVLSAGTRNVLSGSDEVTMLYDADKRSVISGSDDISILSHETVPSFSDDFSIISDPELRTVTSWLRTVPILHGSDTENASSGSTFGTRDYHLQELNVKTERDNCWITGMVVLPDDRLVLTDYYHSSIKAVNVETGQVVAQRQLTGRPWDITSVEKNKVAVTLPYQKKIGLYTVGNNNLSFYDALDVDGMCCGVNFRNGKLAVSFNNPHKVQILNLQGRLLHNIAPDRSGEALFNIPNYLTFGQDDTTLYVSNRDSHNVVYVNMNGTVMATYRDTDLRLQGKAVVDSSGNVFVCAYGSNTVHHITKECKKLQVLLTEADGLNRPVSICLSEEEDKLYVGMWDSDYVKVYRIDRNVSQ